LFCYGGHRHMKFMNWKWLSFGTFLVFNFLPILTSYWLKCTYERILDTLQNAYFDY
jgi:hypothetical protein